MSEKSRKPLTAAGRWMVMYEAEKSRAEAAEAALERIASLSMSQFASASDMAGECANVAREALTGGKDGDS